MMYGQKGPGRLGDAAKRLIARFGEDPAKKGAAVRYAWLKAAGEKAAAHAEPVSYKRNVLMVITESSSWLYKLTLERKDLIKKFNENYAGRQKAKGIRFRVGGVIDGEGEK